MLWSLLLGISTDHHITMPVNAKHFFHGYGKHFFACKVRRIFALQKTHLNPKQNTGGIYGQAARWLKNRLFCLVVVVFQQLHQDALHAAHLPFHGGADASPCCPQV
jgi:hypothetical protein